MMRIQTIIYVTHMDVAVEWYSKVLGVEPITHGSHWSSFRVGGANLALHWTDAEEPAGRVELSLVTTEPLESMLSRLEGLGIEPVRGIADETFGRSIVLRDPAGGTVQVNEHDPELYDD